MLRIAVISLSAFQNASSRLTLVLQRPMTTDLLVFRDFCSWRSTVLCSAVRTRKARLSAARAKRNGPDLIGLELRNEKAVLTFDRNCELLDCGRVSFSLVAGFDSPHVLDLPASDDVYGPANSHGRSVINTSIRVNGGVGEHCRAFCGLYPTRSASAETPPNKYVRTDYCRKNQEASCYRHLFTLAPANVATTSDSIKPSHV